MRRVVFLGQNPARAGNGEPFVGTASGRTLDSWIECMSLDGFEIVKDNVSMHVSMFNQAPSKSQVKRDRERVRSVIDGGVVVCLGRIAHRSVLEMVRLGILSSGTTVLNLPHPSGLNRKLNDREYVASALAECARLIKELS